MRETWRKPNSREATIIKEYYLKNQSVNGVVGKIWRGIGCIMIFMMLVGVVNSVVYEHEYFNIVSAIIGAGMFYLFFFKLADLIEKSITDPEHAMNNNQFMLYETVAVDKRKSNTRMRNSSKLGYRRRNTFFVSVNIEIDEEYSIREIEVDHEVYRKVNVGERVYVFRFINSADRYDMFMVDKSIFEN